MSVCFRHLFVSEHGSPVTPWEPPNPLICSVMIMWHTTSILSGHLPPHGCRNYVLAPPLITLFDLFWVCGVTVSPPAPIRTHPHTHESLIAPFHVCVHIHVFSGLSRAYMHPKPTLLTHFCLSLSCFFVPPCPHTLTHPYKPSCTHPHPFTPVHTLGS